METFRWSYGEMLAVKGSKSTSLYTGMPIWNAYFCDLTGDGLPELCSTFVSIIFPFIYIEVSISFIKSEGKIEISSIRQLIESVGDLA